MQITFKNDKERGSANIANLIFQSQHYLANLQNRKGYWQFALETDTTITSEYILLSHFIGTVELKREEKFCNYIWVNVDSRGKCKDELLLNSIDLASFLVKYI